MVYHFGRKVYYCVQCLAGIADAATRPDPHAHVYYRNKQSLHALVTMSENPRQIPETRTYSGTYATEIAATGSVARHLKCTVTSLRRPSATKGNGKCRSVVLDKDRRNFQEKVRGKTATRHVQEKDAAAQMTRLSKEAMQDLRVGCRQLLLCRMMTLMSVWSSVLPADLEDFVSQYPIMVKIVTARRTVPHSSKRGSISANRVRALHLHCV